MKMFVMAANLVFAATSKTNKQAELAVALQKVLDGAVVNETFAVSLGFVSDDHHIDLGLAAGTWPNSEPAKSTDLFLFGSGTKPYTAASIMKLVEAGRIQLSDKATKYVDPILAVNGTSLSALFGAEANAITIAHLMGMKSGLADFDVPSIDTRTLKDGTNTSPIQIIRAASNCSMPMHFPPGNQSEYSSTNFLLLGLVLLQVSNSNPDTQYNWTTYPQHNILGDANTERDPKKFPSTKFPNTGLLSDIPNLIPGNSTIITKNYSSYHEETIIVSNQSPSILGWTCGNVAAPALEVARWYNDLLAPRSNSSVVSAASLEEMMQFNLLTVGWSKGYLVYGLGLMIESVTYAIRPAENGSRAFGPEDLNDFGVYVGHGGDTYGFESEQGYHPALNSTISVVTNQDVNGAVAGTEVTCKVVQAAAKVLYNQTLDLRCSSGRPHHTTYECKKILGHKFCLPSEHGTLSPESCHSTCK